MTVLKSICNSALLAALSMGSVAVVADERNDPVEPRLNERLLACYDMDSSVQRLECYDRIVQGLRNDAEEARGHSAAAAVQRSAEENRERAAERQQAAQQRASDAREEAASRQVSSADDFGREHRRASSDDEGRRYVEIVEAWQSPQGLWRFRLADGAEWHQTQSDRFDYSEGHDYYIERGLFNSFRLGRDGSNRNIRVRRVD